MKQDKNHARGLCGVRCSLLGFWGFKVYPQNKPNSVCDMEILASMFVHRSDQLMDLLRTPLKITRAMQIAKISQIYLQFLLPTGRAAADSSYDSTDSAECSGVLGSLFQDGKIMGKFNSGIIKLWDRKVCS